MGFTEDEVRRQVLAMKTIAVVGISTDPERPSHEVAKYLLEHGYDIIPVRPGAIEILGRKAYASLSAIDRPVDVVDVFRKSEETPAIAADAVKIGAKALWLQEGVSSAEAERIAKEGGLLVVMDTCIKKNHNRLIGA